MSYNKWVLIYILFRINATRSIALSSKVTTFRGVMAMKYTAE